MKLSEQQLETIDKVLTDLGVTFADYKIEINDHIACEVEEMCANDNMGFDAAFEIVLKKWNGPLLKKGSFWFSQLYSFPKVITDDIAKRARKQQLISVIPLTVFLFCFVYFDIDRKLMDESTGILRTIYFSVFGVLSIFSVKLNYKPVKTSYRFLFNQSFLLFLIFATAFLIADSAGSMLFFYLLWLLTQTPTMLQNAIRHEQCVKKLSC